jgi:hypothetical protein
MDQLRRQIARAKQRSAKARDSVAHQRALILDLEKDKRDTSVAEDVLRTLIETQHLCEDAERRLIHELRSVAPEEWRSKYAEELKAPPANIGNKLLNSLPFTDLALLQPFLERIGLSFRSRLQMANRTMKTIYFPESGMISVVAVSGGGRHQTQIGLIGREGMTGVSLGFGSKRSPFDMEVEVEGQGQCIATEKLIDLMGRSPSIRTALVDYLQTLWLQLACKDVSLMPVIAHALKFVHWLAARFKKQKDVSLMPVIAHALKFVHWLAARFKKHTPRARLYVKARHPSSRSQPCRHSSRRPSGRPFSTISSKHSTSSLCQRPNRQRSKPLSAAHGLISLSKEV